MPLRRFPPWTLSRVLFFLLGCGLFVYLLLRLNPAEVFGLLLEIGWRLAWIAAAYIVHQLIRTAALWRCVRIHGHVPYWGLVRIRLAGEAVQYLTFSGPFLAEPAKAVLLKQHGLSTTRAFAATISEYLIYTFTSAAMAVGALAYLLHGYALAPAFALAARIALGVAAVFLAAAAFAIVRRFYLIGSILNGIAALPLIGKQLRVDARGLRETEDFLFVVLRDRPGRFLSILGIEFCAQVPLLLELYILLAATGQMFSLVDPLLIEACTKFLSLAVFFVPGQIGVSEGLYAAVFQAIGLSASAGFSLALARRLRSLLVSGLGLAFFIDKRRRPGVES